MNLVVSLVLVSLLFVNGNCQKKVAVGVGFEITQTRFRQKAPSVNVEFTNPHKPGVGIGAFALLSFINKNTFVSLQPGIKILRTTSKITSGHNMYFTNLSLILGLMPTEKLQLCVGAEYSYLVKLESIYRGQVTNWTFFSNRNNFLNPICDVGYYIDMNWAVHFTFEYFVHDVFNSGALDKKGNIVGPIKVYPYTFGLGAKFNIDLSNLSKSRTNNDLCFSF